jgi:hypothetical protein
MGLNGPTKEAAEKAVRGRKTSGAKALIAVADYGPTKVVPCYKT